MDLQVKAELEQLYNENGALHPAAVVERASDPESALHKHFSWDDREAAEQHRLNQARQLIRVAVTVIPAASNGPVRQFISVSSLRGSATGSYLATVDVLNNDERRAQVLADAITALVGMEKRFRHLRELDPVFAAIAEVAARHEAKAA